MPRGQRRKAPWPVHKGVHRHSKNKTGRSLSMPEPKTKCSQCGADILLATAERTGGVYMPCKRHSDQPTPTEYEITPADEERFRKNDEIFRRLLEGCTEEEFTKLGCPVCGSALILNVHPELHTFSVRCPVSAAHLMRHESISEAPAWWHGRMLGGWY